MPDLFPALIFDFETTGLPNFKLPADDPSQPRIVSIAGAVIEAEGAPRAAIDAIIKPEGWEIDESGRAFEVHGISNARAQAEGIPIRDALDQFMALWDSVGIVASYGMLFDTKLLRGERRRLSLPDRFGEKQEFCVLTACGPVCRIASTKAMMAAGYRKNKPPKLAEACEILLGRRHENAHTAMADVMVTVDLYRYLVGKNAVAPKRRESMPVPPT